MIDDLLSPRARDYAACYHSLLTRQGGLPRRSSFDPATLSHILDSFVILEVRPPDRVHFRLAGSREVERYGHEVTGENYLDYVPPERRPIAYTAFDRMTRTPCGMQAVIRSDTSAGVDILNEAVGFPFRCDRSGAIHLIFQSNDLHRDPRWEIERLAVRSHNSILRRVYLDVGFGLPDIA